MHITLNGQAEQQVDDLISVLGDFTDADAMPVVFHLRREGYDYQLRTNGGWSLRADERCLLALQRCVEPSNLRFEYP